MGQYHQIYNLDKKQYLNPTTFGDGLKLKEFGCSARGTMTALTILLTSSNGKGGGDFATTNSDLDKLIGLWAGDKIVIVGDYAEGPEEFEEVYYAKAKVPQDIAFSTFLNDYQETEDYYDISYYIWRFMQAIGV